MKSVIILLGAAMLTLTGCSKYKEIRPTSFKLESVSVQGLRAMDIEMAVGVNNPAGQLTISDFSGEVEHSGKVLGNVTVHPLVLHAKSVETYSITADMTLGDGASLLDLGKLLDKKTLEECTVDLQAVVKIGKKAPKPLKFEDIPVKKLMDLVKK